MLKTLAFSVLLAVALSAPSLAQTTAKPVNATPAPASEALAADAATPLDALIDEATTPEDRRRLLLRCAGPPPRPIAETASKELAAAEPVFAVE